jgi:hypothetical protein
MVIMSGALTTYECFIEPINTPFKHKRNNSPAIYLRQIAGGSTRKEYSQWTF